MLRRTLLAAALVFATTLSTHVDADEDLAIIVHKTNPVATLTKGQLDAIFKVRTQAFPDGNRATPVNLPPGTSARITFDEVVLDLKAEDVDRYWIDNKIRSGNGPPRKLPSPGAVVAFVSAEPSGIGYVPQSATTPDVKVVARVTGGAVR